MFIKRGTVSADNIKTGNSILECPNCKRKLIDSEIEDNKCPYCQTIISNTA